MERTTNQWVPRCPVCGGEGVRDVRGDVSLAWRPLALDCECRACGWFYTSDKARAVLRALTRPGAAFGKPERARFWPRYVR